MIALTHVPSPNMHACARTYVPHSPIDQAQALSQHAAYCYALARCGVAVRTLDVNNHLPDCAFIEDTAIVLDEVAVLARFGVESRRSESAAIEPVLREYREVVCVEPPATIEGGDVLRIGKTLLVGQSRRTNAAGVSALAAIAAPFGYSVVTVRVLRCLHLKTACTALPDGRLLVNPDWIDTASLGGRELIPVPEEEPWSANVALVGDRVLASAAHPEATKLIRRLGFSMHLIDLSEFAKAEAGVTCLSLLIQ